MRLDRFCNYIYTWYVSRVKDRSELDMILSAPLPGQKPRVNRPTPADLESEGADFMKFMGQMTG